MKSINWDAQDYARNSSSQQAWARHHIDKLNLKGHEVLLDIGCGDGKISAEIAQSLPRGLVIAIDNSPNMIALAQEKFPETKFANLRFQLRDASDLLFQQEFDIIFSNSALHWIRDHRPLLQGVANALRPHGRIYFAMGGKGTAADVLKSLDEMLVSDKWGEYFRGFTFPYGFYSPGEYKEWLIEVGLEPIRVELVARVMVHKGREGFEGWIRTTWMPYTQRVAEGRRGEFIKELVDRVLSVSGTDGEGMNKIRMVALEVEAEKK